jgi:probable F420-dependent oxidoreductase
LPTCMEGMMYPVPFATPQQVVQIARLAEALGYDSVWGNDHMTTQQYVQQSFSDPPNFWDLLITLAYIAAETATLRVATGVLVPALRRDIVVTAKQIATVDHFSGGRLVLGLGVGAYREEFEALRPDAEVHRGDLLEESVQALRALFEERVVSWNKTYYHFEDVEMYPKPLQNPLPIYIGGNNSNATRRAALYGQGWLPAAMPLARLRERIKLFREMVEEQGRDFEEVDVAAQYQVYIDKTYEAAVERWHRSQMYRHKLSLSASTHKEHAGVDHAKENLIGTSDDVIEKAKKMEEAGVKHLCGLYFCADSVDELVDQMQVFAEEVMPHIAG